MEKSGYKIIFEVSKSNLEFLRVILLHTSLDSTTLLNYALDFYSKHVIADLENIAASPSSLLLHKN